MSHRHASVTARLSLLLVLGLLLAASPLHAEQRGSFAVQPNAKRSLFQRARAWVQGKGGLRVTRFGIWRAHRRIKSSVKPTPLLHSPELSKRYGVDVYLKLESSTAVGSFKIRGAVNKVRSLLPWVRKHGVVAASTGNHAQGVAWAARQSGVPATIVMPEGASELKTEKTRKLGAKVKLAGKDFGEALGIAQKLAKTSNRTFIAAYEDRKVIEGQGTIGREILQQLPDVDWVIGALGGGGLMSGISSAGKGPRHRPTYIGVQSGNNSPMFETLRRTPAQAASFKAPELKKTIADGTLVTRTPSPKMVRLLRDRLDVVVKVPERKVERAVLDLLDRTGHRVEGAGALPLAGLERALTDLNRPGMRHLQRPKKVVLVISGGNIDQSKLDAIRARHER